MPKATRIIQRRYRRVKREQRGGYVTRRSMGIVLLVALIVAVLLIGSSLLLGTVAYAYLTQALPDYDALRADWEAAKPASYEPARIFANSDREEPVLIDEVADPLDGQRQWLTLDQLPPGLVEATIASEDPNYWNDARFGVAEIIRSLYAQAAGGPMAPEQRRILHRVADDYLATDSWLANSDIPQGAITLAQLRRTLITYHISQTYAKSEILEWYLNTAFYGNLAYGVEAAAQVYFNKSVSGLTLAEEAMLAAIPLAPALNPIDDLPAAKARQEQLLEKMAADGSIGGETVAVALSTPIRVAPGFAERLDVIAPHFARYVRQELEARFGPELLLAGGLRVYTTLDLDIQRQAECVARAQLSRLSGHVGADLPADERESCTALQFLQSPADEDIGTDFQVDNAALVVMDAETTGIRAMVGSLNYWDREGNSAFNIAVEGRRQPGTALKPFIYLTALSQGYTPATMVMDIETPFETGNVGNVFVPRNADQEFHGPMRLREALGNDYHVPAVQVMSWVGVDKVVRTARSLGITTLDQAAHRYDLSLPLGGGEVKLLDMVYAYNVMNNMGVMLGQPTLDGVSRPLDPVAILRVVDGNGDVLYDVDQSQRLEILPPQLAYLMNDMLSDRSARCASFGCPNVMELPDNRPVAVVTGSTNDFRDAWTIGYTPQLVVGVWLGNNDNSPTNALSGIKGAAPIWQALTNWIMQSEPVAVWTRPPELVEIAVCDISGLLATPYCPTVSELFIARTQPTVRDTIYQEFAVNRETDRLATIYTPPELVDHRVFRVYPEQAAAWAEANGIERPPTEYDTIRGLTATEDGAMITWPKPFAFVSDTVEIRGSAAGNSFDRYRLAYFSGLTPTNLQVIAADVTQAKQNALLGEWDVSNLDGLYTLLLTVFRQDGSFSELSLPLTVDNLPPTIDIVFPRPNQEIAVSTQRVRFQVRVDDNLVVSQVAYFLDEALTPFATSNSPPFSTEWQVRQPGCHTITAIAQDAAGNETRSTALPICLVENESG